MLLSLLAKAHCVAGLGDTGGLSPKTSQSHKAKPCRSQHRGADTHSRAGERVGEVTEKVTSGGMPSQRPQWLRPDVLTPHLDLQALCDLLPLDLPTPISLPTLMNHLLLWGQGRTEKEEECL